MNQSGRECILGEYDAQMDRWMRDICSSINTTDTVIYIVSPEGVQNERNELALEYAILASKRIVPLIRKKVSPMDVCEEIREMNWIYFSRKNRNQWPSLLSEVFQVIDKDLRHVRLHSLLFEKALVWEGENFDNKYLLKGRDVPVSEEWEAQAARGVSPGANMLHMAYIAQSRKLKHTSKIRQIVAIWIIFTIGVGIQWPSWGNFFFALIFGHIFLYFSTL